MLMSQKLVAIAAGSVIVLAASAQVLIPPCCKYLWEWDPAQNPDPPGGACSGTYSFTCQTGSQNVWGEDPMARQKHTPDTYIAAQCFTVQLQGTAYFVRDDCANGPPSWSAQFIGVLPNGQCCWADGDSGPDNKIIITPSLAGYQIRKCEVDCDQNQY